MLSCITILGTRYFIRKCTYEEDPVFKKEKLDGYTNNLIKIIVYGDLTTFPNWKDEDKDNIEAAEKEILRHEIIHAFLAESGLKSSSLVSDGAWSENEEMVDWFAIQSPKIFYTFKELNLV